jgi:hypothetical protein
MFVLYLTQVVTLDSKHGKYSDNIFQQQSIFVSDQNDEDIWFVNNPKKANGQILTAIELSGFVTVVTKKFRHPVQMEDVFVWQFELKTLAENRCKEYYVNVYVVSDQVDSMNNNFEVLQMKFGPKICFRRNEFRIEVYKDNGILNMSTKHSLTVNFENKDRNIFHIYTVIFRRNQTFEILLNNKVISMGNFSDFVPPIVEQEYVKDASEKPPANWDSRMFINDPNSTKPKAWNEEEPKLIPDPEKFFPPLGGWKMSIL